MDDRVPELVGDLRDQVTAAILEALPIDKTAARDIGAKVAAYITANWGGQLIYIPKNLYGQISARDVALYAKFNGRNHADLAKEYNLTVQQVYRIIKDIGLRERAKNQGSLF